MGDAKAPTLFPTPHTAGYGPGGPSVLIIGAGMGGISMAHELNKRGLTNWTIYEREAGVGGAWWVNRYPGCRADIYAVLYSHSEFPNLKWSESHPERAEIQKYWEDIARRQNMLPRIHLSKNIASAEWDAARGVYVVTVEDVRTGTVSMVEANIVISAISPLSNRVKRTFPGQDDFDGVVIEAQAWPESLGLSDMRGKTVVVVGNGCSGTQIVTALSADREITVRMLARTRQWYLGSGGAARHSAPYTAKQHAAWRWLPALQRAERWVRCIINDYLWYYFLVEEGAAARAKAEKAFGKWMKENVPAYLRDDFVPTYPFGARQMIFEDGYLAALRRPNVRAVIGRLASFTSSGVVLDDGREMPADVVVLATGFDAEALGPPVTGTTDATGNYASKAEWTQYRGTALPGIPNFFTVVGNHSTLSHIIQIKAAYVAQLVAGMRDYALPTLEVKRAAAAAFVERVHAGVRRTTWHEVNNYCRVNGSGLNFTHWPGRASTLWWDTLSPIWDDFAGAEPIVRARRRRRLLLGFGAAAVLGIAACGVQVESADGFGALLAGTVAQGVALCERLFGIPRSPSLLQAPSFWSAIGFVGRR